MNGRLLLPGALLIGIADFAFGQLINGSFETGPFDVNGNIAGWAVTGNVTNTNEQSAISSHAAAFNVGGDSQNNSLAQTFSTTAGQWYQLSFDSRIYNQPSGPLQLNVQVTGNGILLNRSVTPPTPPTTSFQSYRYGFRANSASTTLVFTDVGSGNVTSDTLLDNASVSSSPAPTPGSLPLVNGDFEAGPFDSNGNVSGWNVQGPGDLAVEANEGTTHGSAHAAVFSIGRDSQANILYQDFATNTGQTYNVDFDAGVFGQHSAGPLQFRLRILDANTASSLLDQTVVPPEAGTFSSANVAFNHYHYSFNATGGSAIIEFSDVGAGSANADVVLDTVAVALATASPTPAPGSTPTTLPLNNGSFEAAPHYQIGSITGWTVAGNVASIAEGATNGTYSAALSAGGDSAGNTLSQSFVTTAGQSYNLDFDAGVFGTTDSTLHLKVTLTGNGTLRTDTFAPPYAGTNTPAAVQFSHYRYGFTANSGVTTLEFADVFLGNLNADIVVDQVSVLAQPPTYTQWRNARFNSSQQNDPNVSGWSADPDHDGIENGLEYFFNTDPLAGITAADSAALPRAGIQVNGGSRFLTFTFRRLVGWAGNPAVVAVSDNFSAWDITGNQLEQVGDAAPAGDGTTEIVTMRLKTPISQGVPRKFFVLQLTQ
jgi:hypothetical protein